MHADLSTAVWRKSRHSGANNNCIEVAVLSEAIWRKSRYSGGNNDCVEVTAISEAIWRKSRYSGGNHDCVEVAGNLPGIVAVRDSKDPGGPALVVTAAQWAAFASAVKAGQFGTH
jgi:hypothetical protein